MSNSSSKSPCNSSRKSHNKSPSNSSSKSPNMHPINLSACEIAMVLDGRGFNLMLTQSEVANVYNNRAIYQQNQHMQNQHMQHMQRRPASYDHASYEPITRVSSVETHKANITIEKLTDQIAIQNSVIEALNKALIEAYKLKTVK